MVNFFIFSFLAKDFQTFIEAVVNAADAAFVTVQDGQRMGVVAQGAEGNGDAGFDIADRELFRHLGLMPVHFEVQQRGFDGGYSQEAPTDGVFRLEVEGISLVEGEEVLLRLVSKNGAAGGKAVGEGGGARTGAAFGGCGATGKCAVGTG
jgi:hypothetical protein